MGGGWAICGVLVDNAAGRFAEGAGHPGRCRDCNAGDAQIFSNRAASGLAVGDSESAGASGAIGGFARLGGSSAMDRS